jgi:hypothetical protein
MVVVSLEKGSGGDFGGDDDSLSLSIILDGRVDQGAVVGVAGCRERRGLQGFCAVKKETRER